MQKILQLRRHDKKTLNATLYVTWDIHIKKTVRVHTLTVEKSHSYSWLL